MEIVPIKKAKKPKTWLEISHETGDQWIQKSNDWSDLLAFDDWDNVGQWADDEQQAIVPNKPTWDQIYNSAADFYYNVTLPSYPENKLKRQADLLGAELPMHYIAPKKSKIDDYTPLDDLFNTMEEYFPEANPYQITPITSDKLNTGNFPYSHDIHVPLSIPSNNNNSMNIENEYVQKYQARKAAGPAIRALKMKAAAEAMAARAASFANYDKLTPQERFINKMMYRRKRRYRRKYRRYKRRRYSRYRGRGTYVPSAGTNLGGRMGGWLGATAGEYLGNWGGRVIGLGDYSVRSNVFQGRLPEVTNLSGNGGTIIRFQEYLGDVITSSTPGAFKIDTFMLNASNEKTFPWLSQVAANYDQYEIQGILFNFRSTSANALNSTNTALGTVMFATQYDVVDAPFSSKTEMLNYEFSTSSVPSQDQTHMVECDPHQTPLPLLFTESGSTNPPNTDPRLYFLGRTAIATTGFQGASVNIGELHVTYQVKLLKPKLTTTLGLTNQFYRGNMPANPAFSASQPLGTNIDSWSRYAATNYFPAITDVRIYFPQTNVPKCFFIEIYWSGTNTAAVAVPTISGTNGMTISEVRLSPFTGTTSTRMLYSALLSLAPNPNQATLEFAGNGVFPTGTLTGTMTICEIPCL